TSLCELTTYDNYEILIIDNGSTDPDILSYLTQAPGRVLHFPYSFNYSRLMNLAAHETECDALLFLNNDVEILHAEWLDALLEHAMRPEVGCVGARLYFRDGRPQHEGIYVGLVGPAVHVDHQGYWGLGDMVRNTSAVTAACAMIRPGAYWQVGGFDERLRVA